MVLMVFNFCLDRCGKTGHFVYQCPYNISSGTGVMQPRFGPRATLRGAAGIPLTDLIPVEPNTPGAVWSARQGVYVINRKDA